MQIKKTQFEGHLATIVESERSFGPRGEYYTYLVYIREKLVAIGDEQGNYAGGIYYRTKDGSVPINVFVRLPKELQEYMSCK
jgi:hypothetical protein